MTNKRKRCDDESSPLSASSQSCNERESSSSPSPLPPHAASTYEWPVPASPHLGFNSIAHSLHSRTRKRYRDLRPDESVIHEATLQRLFNAQRTPSITSTLQFQSQFRQATTETSFASLHAHSAPAPAPETPSQPSLHAFWALPQPPPRLDTESYMRTTIEVSGSGTVSCRLCEDCDRPLLDNLGRQPDTNGDGMMDMDDVVMGDMDLFGCAACGRGVCDICAVAGAKRVCLGCMGS